VWVVARCISGKMYGRMPGTKLQTRPVLGPNQLPVKRLSELFPGSKAARLCH